MSKIVSILFFTIIIALACMPALAEAHSDIVLGLTSTLSLSQAIDNALARNRTYDNVKKSLQIAEMQYRATAKERLPKLTTNYSYTRSFNDMSITAESPSLIEPGVMESFVLPFPYDNYMWNTYITMPLFTGGAQELSEAMAKLGIDASRMQLLSAKNELVKMIKYYYYTALRNEAQVLFLEQNEKSFDELALLTRKYHRQGLVARNSVLEAEVERANATQELRTARQNAAISLMALKTAMVMEPDRRIALEDRLERKIFTLTLEDCLDRSAKNNPEIVAYTYLKGQAEKAISLEKASYNPTVNLSAYYLMYGDTPSMQPVPGFPNANLGAMLSLNWLITDCGKKAEDAKIKRLELEQIINRERISRDNLMLNVRDFYSQMLTARENLDTCELAIVAAKENVRIARLRFREQAAQSKEVVDAITNEKKAEFNYCSALYGYNLAIANLEQAMGMDIKKILAGEGT
jgi:outer membrane protein